MTTSNRSSAVSTGLVLVAGLVVASVFALALPGLVNAATSQTYAYVNTSGEVSAVVANDSTSAMATAPNIHRNSGVMLLSNQADFTIVGDSI